MVSSEIGMSGDAGGGSNSVTELSCHFMSGAAMSPVLVRGSSGGGALAIDEAVVDEEFKEPTPLDA